MNSSILESFAREYKKTPFNLKVVDRYILLTVILAGLQFAYMSIAGKFPLNSFLAGFLCCVGSAVLSVCLRMQLHPDATDFKNMSKERLIGDYVLAHMLLFLAVW